MKKNGVKNEVKKPPKGRRFTSTNQPTTEAKLKGWERKKQSQEMMDLIVRYHDMSYKKFSHLVEDLKIHMDKYTMQEIMAIRYMQRATSLVNESYLIDYMDRHVSKAPQDLDIKVNQNIKLTIGSDRT